MNELRAKPGDLCIADAMPFQQHHEYRCTHPIADVLHDKFFLPLRGQLYPGDAITICRFDKIDAQRRDAKLIEVATVRVVASGPNATAVPVLLIGGIDQVDPVRRSPGRPPKQAEAA